MPPRPKTDSSTEVAELVARLAIMTRGQPISAAQVCRMLQTDAETRRVYDAYHGTWSRLDLSLAHSEISITDALRRLEGYANAGYSCRRLQERPGARVHWIFAPLRMADVIDIESTLGPPKTKSARMADALEHISKTLDDIAIIITTKANHG